MFAGIKMPTHKTFGGLSMHDFDVIVIGGGLLGCFVARNLAKYRLKIAIFEEREDLCTGISRAKYCYRLQRLRYETRYLKKPDVCQGCAKF